MRFLIRLRMQRLPAAKQLIQKANEHCGASKPGCNGSGTGGSTGTRGDAVKRRALRVKDAIKGFEKQTREMG